MDDLLMDRRALLAGAAGFGVVASTWPQSTPETIKGSVTELVEKVAKLLDYGTGFTGVVMAAHKFAGAEFDFGFRSGVAIEAPNGCRHGILIPHSETVRLDGVEAAKGAVAELLKWAAHV